MDDFNDKIDSKTHKIKKSLLELNNEITNTSEFLLHLKENSAKMVENLTNITTPDIYLKQFMDVNAYIMMYLNFLTEVNCKIEMLKMSEKERGSLEFVCKGDEISENVNQTNSSSNCHSPPNLNLTKVCETSPDLNSPKEKKEKIKNKNKNFTSSVYNKNINNNPNNNYTNRRMTKVFPDSAQKDLGREKQHSQNDFFTQHKISHSNGEIINLKSIDKNNDESIKQTKVKSISGINSTETDTSINKMLPGNNNSKMPSCSDNNDHSKIMSDSKTTYFTSFFNYNDKKKLKNKMFKNSSIDSSRAFHSSNVQCCKIQTVTENRTDVISSKKFSRNSDEMKNFNSVQNFDKNHAVTKITDIKPPNIIKKLGQEYDVIIKNILSPSEFYVSFIDNQSELSIELEEKLKLVSKSEIKYHNKDNYNKKSRLWQKLGKYALLYSKCEETWFRTEIINKFLNFKDKFVTVFLLDKGETKRVSIYDLQPMPDYFKKYPASVQRCHLNGILPFDVDQTSNELLWDPEVTDLMISLTENSEKIKIRVAFGDHFHPDTSLPVTLFLVDKENQCVNELLAESKYAISGSVLDQEVPNTENSDNVEKEILNDWNPMKEDFESYLNCYDLDINDPAAVIYGYVGKDYKRVCPQFAKTGYCFKGLACKKEHEKLDPSGFTKDQEEIYYDAFNKFIVPPPKTVINIEVTCLISFNQFCCISRNTHCLNDENVESLFNFMNSEENLREMKKLLIPPSVGQIVIAQYPKDYCWYRARILESQPENDLYTVLFTDYGNKEILPLSCIRAIGAKYLHLPFQAMYCIIAGVDINPEIESKSAMNFISQRIYGKMTIEVVSKLPGDGTNLLVHVFDEEGRNIGKDLIDNKYAIYKKEILISNNSESIPG